MAATFTSLSDARRYHRDSGGCLMDWSEMGKPLFAVHLLAEAAREDRPDWTDDDWRRFAEAGWDEVNMRGLTYGDAGTRNDRPMMDPDQLRTT